MAGQHALLSASSAEKWLHCTPSARMEEKFSDTAGESAAEGTLAHELAEIKARNYFHGMEKGSYKFAIDKIAENGLYQKDIDNYTDDYLEYLKAVEMSFSIKPYTVLEVRVDYWEYAPDGYGTVDCVMIGDNVLHIIDFKYGKTVRVDSENNSQLKLYAIGALNKYAILYEIDTVVLHIYQPRMGNISQWTLSNDALLEWAEQIHPISCLAHEGKGFCVVGEWCDTHFCKARAVCRSYISQMDNVQPYLDRLPQELTAEEIGQALSLAENIKKWYSLIEKYVLSALLEGKQIPGYKIVEGRSNRTFLNVEEAYSHLIGSGIDKSVLYNTVPITLTECEKLLGKKSFTEMLERHIVKPPGKPTVVKESDAREKYSPAASDFAGL